MLRPWLAGTHKAGRPHPQRRPDRAPRRWQDLAGRGAALRGRDRQPARHGRRGHDGLATSSPTSRSAGCRSAPRSLVRARRAQDQPDRHARAIRASSPRRSPRCASSTPPSSSSTASMGVEVNTERLWRRADRRGLAAARLRQHARPRARRLLPRARLAAGAFGSHVVATEIPIGSEHEVRGVIDLIDMKAFGPRGAERGAAKEVEIPEELAEQAEEYREKLMDEVAENSDELMERYLEGEEISHDEIVTGAEEGRHRGAPLPGHLRHRDPEPRHQPAARGAGRGPALAGDARRPSRRPTATGRRSRSCPTRTASWSPTSSRRSPTPTPGGSTWCGSAPGC